MEELVMVPVPRNRVLEVYELLGSKSPDSGSSDDGGDASLDGWDAAAFRKHVLRASDTIRGLVSHLADNAAKEVTTEQAAEALKLPYGWNSLAGALGAFGRYCANRDLEFPWDYWYDADGRTVMRMSKAVAREARAAGLSGACGRRGCRPSVRRLAPRIIRLRAHLWGRLGPCLTRNAAPRAQWSDQRQKSLALTGSF